MYREITKAASCLAMLLVSLGSCTGSSESQKAGALLEQATQAVNTGDYQLAVTLTDSLRRAYPQQIELRRKAMHLASRANEGLTLKRLENADSILAATAALGDSLGRLIKKVDNPIEPYFIAASADPSSLRASTSLQGRMSPDGHFYVISSLAGHPVKSTRVSVSDGTSSASTSSVDYDGERNDRSSGAEVITFMGVECDSLGHFVSLHRDSPLTLTFHGTSDYSVPLPAAQARALATVWDYSSVMRRARIATLEKERLTRALDLARSQAARTYVDSSDEKD